MSFFLHASPSPSHERRSPSTYSSPPPRFSIPCLEQQVAAGLRMILGTHILSSFSLTIGCCRPACALVRPPQTAGAHASMYRKIFSETLTKKWDDGTTCGTQQQPGRPQKGEAKDHSLQNRKNGGESRDKAARNQSYKKKEARMVSLLTPPPATAEVFYE